MKLTKQVKADLATAYQCAMEVSILDMKAPLRYINQYIAENVSGFGTAADEKVQSREDYRKMLLKSRQQAKGMLFKAKIITPYRPKFTDETTAQFHDEIVVQIGDKKKRHSIHLYMSCVFKYQFNKWQMVLFHGSMPDAASSTEDIFHIGEAEKKVKELEQVVAQRTADLQRKTRELEIEASLERVRAVTMGMNTPGDILDICKVFFNELQSLGFKDLRNTLINFWDDANGQLHDYDYSDFSGGNFAKLAYSSHPAFEEFQKKIRKAKDAFAQLVIDKKGLKSWQQRRRSSGEYKDPRLNRIAALYYYFYSTGVGALGISTFSPVSKEEVEVLKKFRNVFDMAYQRYVDIQKSAAQAREVQIELALERVRARTMAMQKSEELKDVIRMVLQQFIHLNIKAEHAGFYIDYKANDSMHIWLADPNLEPFYAVLPYFDSPTWKSFLDAKTTGKNFYTDLLDFKTKNKFYRSLFKIFTVPEKAKKFYLECKGLAVSTVLLDNVGLYIENFSAIPYTGEENKILMRFGKVFQQTYTRFLDLQKAEAQAREAQIEVALERVRSRAMAMQSADELSTLIGTVFTELTKLDLALTRCIIWIFEPATSAARWWMANSEEPSNPMNFYIRYHEHPAYLTFVKEWENQNVKFVYDLKGKDKINWDDILFNETELANLPDAVKNGMKAPKRVLLSASFNNFGGINVASLEPLSNEHFDILLRFAKVFDLTYTRFLDLQRAEAQAREAQIETALEKVRSRTMAMQKSEDLNKAASDMFKQIQSLGIQPWACGFNIFDTDEKAVTQFMSLADGGISPPFRTPLTEDSFFINIYEARKRKDELLVWESKDESLATTYRYMFSLPGSREIFGDLENSGFEMPKFQITHCAYFSQGYLVFITYEHVPEAHDIFKRFAKVFEQTYTRFLDLQKAEVQAREAQIEAALEKIRSRSLAMHKSDELEEVIIVVSEQLQKLQFRFHNVSFGINNDQHDFIFWMASPGVPHPFLLAVPFVDNPAITRPLQARRDGNNFISDILSVQENREWLQHLFNYSVLKNVSEENKNFLLNTKNFARSQVLNKHTILTIGNYAGVPYTDEQNAVLKRFGNVFEQAYTRFLDLEKAEVQARESKIQLALERVRARTMAMQRSEELPETSYILFQQMKELGEPAEQLTVGIVDEGNNVVEVSATLHGSILKKIYLHSIDEPYMMNKVYNAWKNQQKALVVELKGDELNAYNKYRNELTKSEMFPTNLGEEHRRIVYAAFFSKGMLALAANDPRPQQSLEILERFASAFDLTYTRFLDLQKAESRAREAKIEAALERVRSKAMAMHSSEDLTLTVDSFFSELEALHVTPRRCGLGIINRESRVVDIHVTTNTHENERKTMIANLTLKGHPVLNAIFENWEQQQEYHPVLYGSEIKSYYEAMNPEVVFPNFPSDEVQYGYYFFFKEGGVFAWTDKELGERDLEIFRRYTSVLSLTYRRFMDLREAEAQAREAKIEAALEKVRSRTLAMQKSDELAGTAAVLFQQLIALGIAPNRLYIILIKENIPEMDAWVTDEDGSKVSMGFTGNYLKNSSMRKMYEGWEQQRKSLIIDMQGEELQQYFHYLHDELKVPFKGGLGQKRRIQHLAYFSHGLIGMASPDEQPAETLQLMERFAAVFNLTFTRFNDLKIAEAHALQAEQDLIAITEAKQKAEAALTELQATQKQLVQSEKMASLGELTAGIAHEIQNPLNFVNNFSEVSKELLDEMKDAIEKGDTEDAKEIMYDVIQNLEKINHHGKRADGIVKGMLQHSRTSSGQKELTDINALCDEYLRLAYHGLRAKDKSFNAKFETHFDEAVGKLSVIPQDIGRVVLNLINNAFYAVSERKKLDEPGYEPAVHVSTSKEAASITIKVKDNGTGIPQRVLDKIFQPFFTTKPTGQGTGLGLSLSYDIVTKGHAGELKVETKEGEGTAFVIQIPV